MSTDLTVVIPTFNESPNIAPLISALEESLQGINWEAIVVDDDSPDETARIVRDIARQNPRIRIVHRIGRRGLSSACIEGMLASASPYLAVMDADLQHDESLLPEMYKVLKSDEADLVIASRYMHGASTGALSEDRIKISRVASMLSRYLLKTEISDPMSGFFMLKRDLFEKAARKLYGRGFKILLDIIASSKDKPRIKELPYHMRERQQGESKLDTLVILEYLLLLFDKKFGRIIPARFLLFISVGLVGVGVHLTVLALMHTALNIDFVASQASATFIAMTNNYILNNIFTHRDRRLRGARFFRGILSFYAACSLGAILNIALAQFLFNTHIPWWLAGLAGAGVGAIWNYMMTSVFTWGSKQSMS